MKTGVYCIKNKVNGKCYIGSTSQSFHARFAHHKNALKRGVHCNRHLQRAWQKYGEQSFEFFVLELASPEKCIEKEQWYLDAFKPHYNQCKQANSRLGTIHSEDTKRKMSQSKIGTQNPAFGKGFSAKSVILTHLESKNIQVFDSVTACARIVGVNTNTLSMILHGKNSDKGLRKKGYSLQYASNVRH